MIKPINLFMNTFYNETLVVMMTINKEVFSLMKSIFWAYSHE